MNKVKLSYEDINPFIRYAHMYTIWPSKAIQNRYSYDCRLWYIMDGSGTIILDESVFAVTKGCILYWQPGTSYSLIPEDSSKVIIIGINFNFTNNFRNKTSKSTIEFGSYKPENIFESYEFIDNTEFNKVICIYDMKKCENLFLNILDEYQLKEKNFDPIMRGYLISLLSLVSRITSTRDTKNPIDPKFYMILHYLLENYNLPLKNEDISYRFNYHPIYLNRLIKKYTGQSLHQFILSRRVQAALKLLQTTDKTIQEISYETGFGSSHYLSKYFKKIYGKSPRKYLKDGIHNI